MKVIISCAQTWFRNNAYVQMKFVMVPYKGVKSGPKDDFNLFSFSGVHCIVCHFLLIFVTSNSHFLPFISIQLCIAIECAFGMLVHCWSILSTPLHTSMGGNYQIALTYALCKLHNFCISSASASNFERQLGVIHEGGVELDDDLRPEVLLDGAHHFDDVVQFYFQGLHQ